MSRPGGEADSLPLALARYRGGDHARAVQILRRVLKADPANADAHNLLGAALLAQDKPEDAARAFRQATSLSATASHHYNLAQALATCGRHSEAAEQCRAALALTPDHAGALSALGCALRLLGDHAQSLECHRRAVALAPAQPSLLYNHAIALSDHGDFPAAARACRAALASRPDYPEAQFLLAELCLRAGEWSEGWARYEHRFRLNGHNRQPLLVPRGLPPWQGQTDKRPLLLICEQGFGDTFLFIRYAQVLAARGLTIDVAVPPPVAPVIVSAPGIRRVLTTAPNAKEYCGWLPLGSLPSVTATPPDRLPPPYLSADPEGAARWRQRLDGVALGRRKIGLVWAGSPGHVNDGNRSLDPTRLAPLATTGCHFFCLQKDRGAESPPPGLFLTDLGPELKDFADTAAILSALDLLLSVDTSVANLAGAMGVPAWVLLGTPPEWRWGLPGRPSPWYPALRAWQQDAPGAWDDLLARVAAELGQS